MSILLPDQVEIVVVDTVEQRYHREAFEEIADRKSTRLNSSH